jgi:hypothetical protein
VIRILKDPLVHFLAAGLAIFLVFMAVAPDDGDEDPMRIVVDRPALLEFLQFRARAFEPERANAMLDVMGRQELDALIRDYVREEALYREATALGLDKTDYVIKRRLVQTVEFVAGNAAVPEPPDEKALAAYFAARADAYAAPASITFTHVFFDAGRGGEDAAAARAAETLAILNGRGVGFAEAPGWGDRFAYNVNYVDRPMDAVAGHFGDAFARQVFALPPDVARWQGPVQSAYGIHLVLVAGRQEARVPPLAEIADRVGADYLAEQAARRRQALIDDMLRHYEVEVRFDGGGTAKAAFR